MGRFVRDWKETGPPDNPATSIKRAEGLVGGGGGIATTVSDIFPVSMGAYSHSSGFDIDLETQQHPSALVSLHLTCEKGILCRGQRWGLLQFQRWLRVLFLIVEYIPGCPKGLRNFASSTSKT